MTSAEPVLCRLELDAFGTPPRRLWLEARERPQGFSVWFWDEHLYPDGTELGASNSAYETRAFARIILDVQLAAGLQDDPENWVNVPASAWRAVKVTGERGLRAALLSLALTTGRENTGWFMKQSDISFETLHALVDELDDDWWRLLDDLWTLVDELKLDWDAMSLLQRYGLPPSATGLQELYKVLDREREWRWSASQAERQALIAPFRDEIEAIAKKFSDRPMLGGGSSWPSKRAFMTLFLDQYVVDHRHMPRGEVWAEVRGQGVGFTFGTIDFEQLRALEDWPH